MKRMHIPQHILVILAIVSLISMSMTGTASSLLASDTTAWTLNQASSPDKPAPDKPAKSSNKTPATNPDKTPAPAEKPSATPDRPTGKLGTVDQIKGIGKFNLGQNFSEFPPTLLRVVDPKASGILLRVSPYGENYLVTDVSGMTWGGIPIAGMVLTFHAGVLIDIQVALKAKKFDLYTADRAFKTKYGPNDPKTLPVETWKGNLVQMTLIFPGSTNLADANSLDATTQGKIDLFDQYQWNKFEAARIAALKDIIEKRYQAAAPKVQGDL